MRRFARLLWVLCSALLGLPQTALPQATDAAVKAGFIYNFTKFVEWPPNSAPQMQFCLVGSNDPLLGAVAALEGKQSRGREIRVRRASGNADALRNCDLIVVGASEAGNVRAIVAEVRVRPALTVSDIDNFVEAGGMIGLVINDSKVQFEINAAAAQHANLQLGAQLMKLARSVKR
jgi:uncharacterized protein DUF4154